MSDCTQLAEWIDRADRLSPYSQMQPIRDLIAAAPATARGTDRLEWWRGVEDGRIAVTAEQSPEDAMLGLRDIQPSAKERRAGFQVGIMVQTDLDEVALDVMADAENEAAALAEVAA